MPNPILVVGSTNVDLIATTDRLPLPGETVLGVRFLQAHGGKGANQAVAAARSGARVTYEASQGVTWTCMYAPFDRTAVVTGLNATP